MSRIIIRDGNLLGVMNELGKVIIKPHYEGMKRFTNGFAAVCMNGRWGYIDHEGNQIINFLYHDAKSFSRHGVAPVKLKEKLGGWALINISGDLVQMQHNEGYYYISDFNAYGYAIAKYYGRYYIIDTNGRHVNDDMYYWLEYIEDQQVFIGEKVGKLCFTNAEGKVVIDPKEDYEMIYYPENGYCQVEKDDKMGYISEDGQLAIPLKYQIASAFSENGLAYVQYDNGRGGYIGTDGEFVIKPIFDSGTGFEFGKAAVSLNGQYIYIDQSGKKSIDHIFNYAGQFSKCGIAKVELRDGRVGFIRPNGKMAFILKEGWEVDEFIEDQTISPLKVEGKVGLINDYGKVILGPCYEKIEISVTSGLNAFCQDGLWGYIDDRGTVIIENTYEQANAFTEDQIALVTYFDPIEDQMIRAYINDQNALVDDEIIESLRSPFSEKYSKLERFYQGLALATKKEDIKILNAYGQQIIGEGFKLRINKEDILKE